MDTTTDITFDTCGSSYDTYLYLYSTTITSSNVNNAVWTLDDSCDDCGSCGNQAVWDVTLVAGYYLIKVAGYSTYTGSFQMTMTCTVIGYFSTDMDISSTGNVAYSLQVTSIISNSEHNVTATFNAVNGECKDPTLTVVNYEIDYDGINEYFNVYKNDMSLITQCGSGACENYWTTCFSSYSLSDVTQIAIGESYTVTIIVGSDVSLLCGTYSLYANLTIGCAAITYVYLIFFCY